MYKRIIKPAALLLTGGVLYSVCEIIFRGYTHWTMFILGGVLFVIIGLINEKSNIQLGLIPQAVISSFIITVFELAAGLILNVWLKLNIWDYSHIPYSFMGQINPFFSIIWFFLSLAAIILDDVVRCLVFNEPMPKYKLL